MGWYNTAWLKRVKITARASKVDEDLTGFPIYVNLADLPADFHTNCNQTDARDIRITKADGTTELPREVVSYDSGTDQGELYFKGDVLNSSDVDFYIYYDNPAAPDYAVGDQYGRNAVWSSYRAVYHMGDEDTSTIKDSTGNFNGTKTGADQPIETTNGKFGKGQSFAGQYRIDVPDSAEQTEVSYSLWAKTNNTSKHQYIICRCKSDNRGWVIDLLRFLTSQIDAYTYGGMDAEVKAGTNDTNWAFLALTIKNNDYVRLYKDGAGIGTPAPVGVRLTGGNMYQISAADGSNMSGILDEIRIIATQLSDGYISTQYNNQFSPATFFQINEAEDVPVTTLIGPFPTHLQV